MAKNTTGSVAPKERINISYRPANGTTTERVELPFKMMVLGKFSTEDNASPLADRSPININKANFDEVIDNVGVTLNFSIENHLTDGGENIDVHLPVSKIKDFEPDSILDAIPELRKTIEARNALKALKGPIGNVPGLRKTLKLMLENPDKRDQLKHELGL